MYTIVDSVLRAIETDIAAYPPERGGALLGVPGKSFITRFVLDEGASVTRYSYRPSARLTEIVREIELGEGLQLMGVVHSHPGFLDRPSGPDMAAFAACLDANPHINDLVVPIATMLGSASPKTCHEIALGACAKLSVYVAGRKSGGRRPVSLVKPLPLRIMPLARDLEGLRTHLEGLGFVGAKVLGVLGTALMDDVVLLTSAILTEQAEFLFFFHEAYPMIAPLLLVTDYRGRTFEMDLEWRIGTVSEQRLTRSMRAEALSSLLRMGEKLAVAPVREDAAIDAAACSLLLPKRDDQLRPVLVSEAVGGAGDFTPGR